LSLQPLAPQIVGKIIANQRPNIEADQLDLLGRLAEGSPGRALNLADSDGLNLYRELFTLISGLPEIDMLAVHRLGDRLNRKEEVDTFNMIAFLLTRWLEQMIKGLTTGYFPTPIIHGEAEVMMRLAQTNSLERWCEVWEKVRDLFSATNAVNLERKQVLLNVFSTLQTTSRA
tara:strand:- start:126 stop:644 length:519 start_codon:yes stop_codon:yes gene_type:complete